jgi:putative nucleotidyltransferase with HDIG domain
VTHARYTPQMVVATVCVLLVPAAVVSLLHARGSVTSFWACLLLALCLTFLALTIGASYWRRRRPPASVLFSDLMIWGWIRDQYVDHKLAGALHSLDRLRAGEVEQRRQVLREIATAVDSKDPFLTGHSRRVARYVTAVARRMHVERREAERMRTAALLHDVGKLHTPAEVLMRPSKLSAADTAIMRRHAEDGAEMVATLSDPELADIVRHHHERFDGTGYPDGLWGDAIPLGSRIIAVADTFDAITSARPYRAALPHQAAVTVLRDEAGAQFDPAVVRAFIAEYTDRSGVMIWAAAGQLARFARVAGVAAAAVVLNAFTFMASNPASITSSLRAGGRGPVEQTFRPTPRPSRAPSLERRTQQGASGGARHPTVAPATATTSMIQTAASAQPAPTQLAPTRAGVQAGPHAPASRPVYQPAAVQPQRPRVTVAPEAVAGFRTMGTAIDQSAVALRPPPIPGTAPTLPTRPTVGTEPTPPTQPTTPVSPPSTTSPTIPIVPPPSTTSPTIPIVPPPSTTSPTIPTLPENADECKDGGWKTLGFENQGQCIASVKRG